MRRERERGLPPRHREDARPDPSEPVPRTEKAPPRDSQGQAAPARAGSRPRAARDAVAVSSMDESALRVLAVPRDPILGQIHGVDPRTGVYPTPAFSPVAVHSDEVFGSPKKLELGETQIWQQSTEESHGVPLTTIPFTRSVPRTSHSHPLPPRNKESLAYDTPRKWVRVRDPAKHWELRRSYGRANKALLDRYRFHGIKKKNLQPAWQTWERLNSSPTRQLRPATAGSKGAYYRIPRPGTSRPVIPREGPPDPTLVIATYNSISGKQPYVCGRGKHGTFPPSLTPPS